MPMRRTVGLIAGDGRLPLLLAKNIRAAGYRVVAVGHIGQTKRNLQHCVDTLKWVHVGELGKIITLLEEEGVKSVIFIGRIAKTHFFSGARPDARALKVLSQLQDRKDDAILRGIAEEIEREGIRVESPLAFLKDSLAPKGCFSQRMPTERERKDITFGWRMAKRVGSLDVGQSIVVKDQIVLAVEAIEGTDETIRRGGKLGRGGVVVVKVCKPKQDPRLDLPVIGPATIATLKEAGASVLAVEAQKTIIVDKERVIREANRNHLCLIGI